MKRTNLLNRPLVVAMAAALAALALGHAAQAGPSEPEVPGKIAVPAGNKLFLVGHAVGVQIHTCVGTADGHGWRFDGPRADVFDDRGKLLMTHFAGPSWQARDGSFVKAGLRDRVNVDPTAIDWLLLHETSAAAGADGDRLAGTTFIQRIRTVGGLTPPAAECNESTVGTTNEVPYTADYTFWKKN